jgi:hypothetical protein
MTSAGICVNLVWWCSSCRALTWAMEEASSWQYQCKHRILFIEAKFSWVGSKVWYLWKTMWFIRKQTSIWERRRPPGRPDRGLHGRLGHVSPSGLAHPGPLSPLFLFYFISHLHLEFLLGWPTVQKPRGPGVSRPFLKIWNLLFLLRNQWHGIAIISRSTNPNWMKPIVLNQKFQYLSNATGTMFLWFF